MRCVTQQMSVGMLWTLKNRIDLEPPYQREAGIWSPEKKQLFMDSLLNKYDVPKLYFHDRGSEKGPWAYAVIDGKQRLTSVWDFMIGKVSLADDFKFTGDPSFFQGEGTAPPSASSAFVSWDETQKEYFKNQTIDVVQVMEAEEDDIEELFSRLNNGEPLNAAEKRNAMGGDMIQLVRALAKRDFLKDRLGFADKRMSYHEVAAKLIRLEESEKNGQGMFCDLKKKHLDALVKKNKTMSKAQSRNPQLRPIVGLLLLTGARVSELLHAEWSHIDLNRRAWLIPISKTGKSRYVPLSQAAIDLIDALPRLEGCPWLIPNLDTGTPFVSIKHGWQKTRNDARLHDLRIHDLRHSAASFMINAGIDLFAVGKVLGHADYKSTTRYSHLANETLLSAVEAGASKLSAQWAA